MNSKASWRGAILAILVCACSSLVLAQIPKAVQLSGVINGYTPSSVSPAGPWEVRGTWSMTINQSGIANFSAALNMDRSDYWVTLNPSDVDDPSTRSPHTHNLSLTNATVTAITGGFEISGTATLLANGGTPPFGTSVPVVIDVTGGANLKYSNVAITFQSPADGHFGTEAIGGVVQKVSKLTARHK